MTLSKGWRKMPRIEPCGITDLKKWEYKVGKTGKKTGKKWIEM